DNILRNPDFHEPGRNVAEEKTKPFLFATPSGHIDRRRSVEVGCVMTVIAQGLINHERAAKAQREREDRIVRAEGKLLWNGPNTIQNASPHRESASAE